jgi:hypothetical protein
MSHCVHGEFQIQDATLLRRIPRGNGAPRHFAVVKKRDVAGEPVCRKG